MSSAHPQYIQNPDIVASLIDDELIMMSVQTSKYFTLNSTAALVWSMMETPVSQAEIVAGVLQKYNVAVQTCETEVAECIELLKIKSLIFVVGS